MIPYYQKPIERLQVMSNSLPGDLTFPTHMHEEIELHFVRQGLTKCTVGNHEFTCGNGDAIIIFPNQLHRMGTVTELYDITLIFNLELTGLFRQNFSNYLPDSVLIPADTIPADVQLVLDRLVEYEKKDDFLTCHAWLQVLLANILPLLDLHERIHTDTDDLSYRMIHYISEHFQEPLTLESVARQLHVNKYYLAHTFSTNLNTTFLQYLTQQRIEYAAAALQATDNSIIDIWQDAGFSSQQTFNRAFQKVMGMTPSDYRKNVQNLGFTKPLFKE